MTTNSTRPATSSCRMFSSKQSTTRLGARSWFLGALLVALVCSLAAPAALADLWTGSSGSDLNWSTAGNWDLSVPGPTDDVLFDATAVVFDTSIDNTVDASTSIQSLSYMNTNSITGAQTYHNTAISDGQTLTVSSTSSANVVFVGSGLALTNAATRASISGPNGALIVSAPNGVFNVRQGGTMNITGTAVLDMAGLSNCTVTVKNLLVAGDGTSASPEKYRASGTLNLAQYTTLNILGTTPIYLQPGLTLGFINSPGGAGGHLALGQTNYIFSDSGVAVGLSRAGNMDGNASAPCRMSFNPAFLGLSPYAYFRNLAGTGRQSQWLIGDGSWLPYSGNGTAGTVDFSGGTLDAQVDQLLVGRSVPSGIGLATGGHVGVLTLDTGTLDVNTVTIGYQMSDYCPKVEGTVNVNGTAQLIVNTSLQLGHFMGADPAPNSTNGVSFAKLNISGGSVTVNGPITTVLSALNDLNDSEINLYAGSLYLKSTVGPLYQFTLNTGTTNTFDLGASPNPTAPLCSVTNLITAYPVVLNVLATALGNGTIHVIKYQNWSGSFSDFVAVPPAKFQGYFTNNTAIFSIDLVITNTIADSWNGRTNGVNIGNWDINITPDWKSGTTPATYLDGDVVIFDDTAAGTTTVNLTTNLSPPAIYANLTNKNYTYNGSGQLIGTGSLNKNGSGMLTVANMGTNTFTGPVLINAGTVQISGSDNRLPTNAAVTLGNAVGATLDLNNVNQSIGSLAGGGTTGGEVKLGSATLTLRGTTGTTYGGVISGNGSLLKTNSGTQILTGANTYSGGTIITNSGVLMVQNTTGSGLGSGNVDIESLGQLWIGNGTAAGTVSASTITNNTSPNTGSGGLYFNRSDNFTFTNFLTGTGQLFKNAANTVTIATSNNFSGLVTLNASALRVAHPAALGTAPVTGKAWDVAINNGAGIRLELSNSVTFARRILVSQRSGTYYNDPEILSVSGTNILTGLLTQAGSGTVYDFQAAAGSKLVLSNTIAAFSSFNTGTPYYELGGAGDGEVFPGLINGLNNTGLTNSLYKDGTGIWTLWGTNTYIGCTIITNGTLVVNGVVGGGGKLGNSPQGKIYTDFIVLARGTLGGIGRITPAVTNYGVLAPGTVSSIGTLAISNYLTLVAGSSNIFRVSQTGISANDQVVGITKVTYGGKLKVTLLPSTLIGGEVFKLFSATTYAGSFSSIDLPTIPVPLSWDTTQLSVDGTLRVNGTLANKTVGFAAVGDDIDKNFQMSGSSTLTNWTYRILATTNVADALLSWTQIGSGTFTGGVFSFTDVNATNYPQRFYRVVAP